MRRWLPFLAASLVAAAMGGIYVSSLLPGFDLGDTASFQTMAGSPYLTPRDGYPLFYVVGNLCLWLSGSDPAWAMNLASALAAALACGLVVLVATELSASLMAGVAAALLLGGSYTFWSQAIIAEVYALHMFLVVLVLWMLLRWEACPTGSRLTIFFASCALAFGNHLSTVLLVPGFVFFLSFAVPRGWKALLTPRVVATACAIAALGTLQYAWNFTGLWHAVTPPVGLGDAFATFWFDVTKADWRESMVLNVPWVMAGDRFRMYLFDVRQQFGWGGPALAAAGFLALWRINPHRAILLGLIFAATMAFALSYNVGDAHVFFLPSHLTLALLAAPALAWFDGRLRGGMTPVAIVLIAGRLYAEYPALDRSDDRRPTELLSALAQGIDDHGAVLLTEVNWQIQNGMYYFSQEVRPDLAYARFADLEPHLPVLLADNQAIGRQVVVTDRAVRRLEDRYGGRMGFEAMPSRLQESLIGAVDTLPQGMRYALVFLRPLREYALETAAISRITAALGGGVPAQWPARDYVVMAGIIGRPPALLRGEDAPWAARVVLDGLAVDIRLDAWLAFDTIRRMGFGSVIAGRRRALIVERGLSFVALGADGSPLRRAYLAGIYEPLGRFTLRPAP